MKKDVSENAKPLKNGHEITASQTRVSILRRIHMKRSLIKSMAKDILYNSTAQALIKITQTQHVTIKIFLILCLTLAAGFSAYLVSMTLSSYYNYEVFTTTRTIFETTSYFPKVTVCNTNPFITEYALDFLQEVNRNELTELDVFSEEEMTQLTIDEKMNAINILYLLAVIRMNNKNTTRGTRKRLGHDLADILLGCNFNNQKCTAEDFVWKFDESLGNCYTFNSGFDATNGNRTDLKNSTISGAMHGLQIELYVNFHEDLKFFNSKLGTGALIRIENNSFLSDSQYSEGIRVSPGFETSISIDRLFKFNLPKPYSNCDIDNTAPKEFDSYLYKKIANSTYNYNQQLCFTQCLQQLAIDTCNCTIPVFFSFFDVEPAASLEQNICFLKAYYETYLSNNFIKINCLPLCPLECNKTEYKTSISFQIIGDWFVDYINDSKMLSADFVKKPINSHTTKESVVKVNAFYDSLSYTISTEAVKMNWVLLLANIGGTLGLFLGISVLSLCEIAEVLIEIYYVRKEEEKVYGIL